jgi:hypothetical protein
MDSADYERMVLICMPSIALATQVPRSVMKTARS